MNKIISCLLVLFSQIGYSQKKNTLCIHTENIWFRSRESNYNPLEQYGFYYARIISKKISVSLSYSQWYKGSLPSFSRYYRRVNGIIYEPNYTGFDTSYMKKVFARENYRFVDISTSYKIYQHKKIGCFSTYFGISCDWGKNHILDTLILPTVPPFDNFDTKVHTENKFYIGFPTGLSYDYYIWKERFLVGVQLSTRKYFGYRYFQYEWGFHLGYNF